MFCFYPTAVKAGLHPWRVGGWWEKLAQAVSQKLLGVGCGYLVGLLVGDVGV